ncbi:hypothetical protein [Nonomuraea sp. NPDC003709]|uniref:hypothetical protein n=1 Tax=Nonomuraea sp. NPDC003709 TaxID=3154450 RepID=UPI0033A275F4
MPSKDQVPEGPHRELLVLLFQMYRAAGRPPLKQIVFTAERLGLDGTASQETVRRTLHGKIIPERWETAYAVYAPLCALAGIDPDAEYYRNDFEGYGEPDTSTHKELFRQAWSAAFDTEELPPPILGARAPQVTLNANLVPVSDFSGEPPF